MYSVKEEKLFYKHDTVKHWLYKHSYKYNENYAE